MSSSGMGPRKTYMLPDSSPYGYLGLQIDTWYFISTAILDAEKGDDVNAKAIFLFTEAIADPAKMLSLFDNAAYAAQDWVHLCTWDMLVRSTPHSPRPSIVYVTSSN
eukprot:scaffold27746_cov37-Prasinocladus_malaysianus.AAC.3